MPPQLRPDSLCLAPAQLAALPGLPASPPLPLLLPHVAVPPQLLEPASVLALQHTHMDDTNSHPVQTTFAEC